jgi:hypothetical protein
VRGRSASRRRTSAGGKKGDKGGVRDPRRRIRVCVCACVTNPGEDDLLRGAVFVLQRPSYGQALRGGAYPVPRMHDHAFCAGVSEPQPSGSWRGFVVVCGIAKGLDSGVGGASIVRYRREGSRMYRKSVGRSGGP